MFIFIGSIYLLAILACAQAKSALLKLPMDQIIRLGSQIRCPSPGKFLLSTLIFLYDKIMATIDTLAGKLIITDIIPAIAKLRSLFDIKFTTMFSYHLLLQFRHPLHITSSNISKSDEFFDSIAFK